MSSVSFHKLDELSHWDKLFRIGTSGLIRWTTLVPVIGYLILFNAELSAYLRTTFDTDVGISWRMYFLYFGLTFTGVGSIIFSVWCPDEIKEHGTAYDFVYKEAEIVTDERLKMMRDRAVESYFGLSDEWELTTRVDEGRKDFVMVAYFEALKASLKFARIVVAVLYILGILVLAVPTIITFGQVVLSVVL